MKRSNIFRRIADISFLFLIIFNANFLNNLIGNSGYLILFFLSIYLIVYTTVYSIKITSILNFNIYVYYGFLLSICLFKEINNDIILIYFFDASAIFYLLNRGEFKLRKGLITMLFINLFILFYSNLIYPNEKLFLAIYSGGEEAVNSLSKLNRFQGLFGTPGFASLNLSLVLIYFLNSISLNKTRYSDLFIIIITIVLGLYTGNRSFIISMGLTFFIFIVNAFWSGKILSLFKIENIFLFVVLIFCTLNVMNSDFFELFYLGFSQRFEAGFDNRISGTNGFSELIRSLSFNEYFFGAAQTISGEFNVVISGNKYQPHNAFLYLLSSFGLIPFILSSINIFQFVYFSIKNLISKNISLLLCVLLTIFLFFSAEVFFLSPIQTIFLLFISSSRYNFGE